eukprot:352865-Chlamydomonas_euryale.AAC.11
MQPESESESESQRTDPPRTCLSEKRQAVEDQVAVRARSQSRRNSGAIVCSIMSPPPASRVHVDPVDPTLSCRGAFQMGSKLPLFKLRDMLTCLVPAVRCGCSRQVETRTDTFVLSTKSLRTAVTHFRICSCWLMLSVHCCCVSVTLKRQAI